MAEKTDALIHQLSMRKNEERERVRKAYAPKGERGQIMMSFRIDVENVEWLQRQPNKGRAVNAAIADYIKRNKG